MSYVDVPVARVLPFCQAQMYDGNRYHRCNDMSRPNDCNGIHRCDCGLLWADPESNGSES